MIALDAAARPSCAIGASVWAYVLDKSACPHWAVPTGIKWIKKKRRTEQIKYDEMTSLEAAVRPSCAIGASMWAYVLDKSACLIWAVPTGIKWNKKQKEKQTRSD